MNNAIMLDLETLSTKNDAMIVSIGAVAFDTEMRRIDPDNFYSAIKLESATGHISTDTVRWWMAQSDEARAVFSAQETTSEALALLDFDAWIRAVIPVESQESVTVWSNGASFDCVVLRNAYERNGYIPPWKWYNDRCYRTYMRTFEHHLDGTAVQCGVAHNALDDAQYQAERLLELMGYVEMRLF